MGDTGLYNKPQGAKNTFLFSLRQNRAVYALPVLQWCLLNVQKVAWRL